jgi:hypothetical protein
LDEDFRELLRTGSNVTSATMTYGDSIAAFSDDDGLHSCTFDTTVPSCPLVSADACNLRAQQGSDSSIIIAQQPCASTHVMAVDLSEQPYQIQTFDTDADTAHAVAGETSPEGRDEVAMLFLTDIDSATGLGTLWAARQHQPAIQLGTHAVLDDAFFQPISTDVNGTAIVDADPTQGTGRWVTWNWQGQVQTVAENVLYHGLRGQVVFANYDGHSCDEEYLDGTGALQLIQAGAAPVPNQVTDVDLQISLRLDHFDGTTGTLAQTWNSADDAIATGVAPLKYDTLSAIPLDGFGYIASWNASLRSGTLFVHNQRLGATASVASGVSDFFGTSYPLPGIAYTVPAGSDAGIWFARAK